MELFNKLKWILGILLVFVIIATTNLIDRNNFIQLKDSVETIYRDRLIAKDLILDIYKLAQEKEIAALTKDEGFFNGRNEMINEELKQLIETFEKTELTEREEVVLKSLKDNVSSARTYEVDIRNNGFEFGQKHLLDFVRKIEGDLNALSDIQISEGSRQVAITKRATDSIELFTQLEIYMLIFLAIVIQIIIIYKPK